MFEIIELGSDPHTLVKEGWQAAYDALPECYQADHALRFFTVDGQLFANHDLNEEEYMFLYGMWSRSK